MPKHHHYNISFLIFGLVSAFIIYSSPFFNDIVISISNLGYYGAYFSGMFFTSTFTVATGGLLLIGLSNTLNPILLIIFSALGAVTIDLLIFYIVKDNVVSEITPVYEKFIAHHHLKKILHTRYFSWTLPVLGAIVIASPLPDELGVSLLGISAMTITKFALISFFSHTIGMITLVLLAGTLM
ncbi:MAG: hypothetical protein WC069_05325 [Candidatus Shapirobacteria bacterium]